VRNKRFGCAGDFTLCLTKEVSVDEAPLRAIWSHHEAFYIQSMLFNAESATTSIEQFNSIMHVALENSPENPFAAIPVRTVLGELQNVIVQAASLSRYFWPARAEFEWRGAQLRTVFTMSDDSPLKSREMRNAVEHFDERIDKYLELGVVGHIVPEYVGPVPDSRGVPVHMLRAYYVDTGVFEMFGGRYEINPIASEVIRVHKALIRMYQQGGRFGVRDA
jgi:hypothetical protein